MCASVFTDNNEELTTVDELVKFLNVEPVPEKYYSNINLNSCLCQVNVELMVEKTDYDLTYDGVNFYLKKKI